MSTAAFNFFGNVLQSSGSDSGTDIFTGATTNSAIPDVSFSNFAICVGAALVIGFLISLLCMNPC